MGTLVITDAPMSGGRLPTVSTGGIYFQTVLQKATMGATYAGPGGDTVAIPPVPTNYDLWAVEVISHDAGAGIDIVWNHSVSTPKLIAYDEDNTSGVAAEISNGSNALAAVVVYLRFIFRVGI